MKLYSARHSHQYGESNYTFQAEENFTADDFIEFLGDEYEPDKDEFIEVEQTPIYVWSKEKEEWVPAKQAEASTDYIKDTSAALDALRALLGAYENDPRQVDFSKLDEATQHMLKAFGLPENHFDKIMEMEEDDEPGGMQP